MLLLTYDEFDVELDSVALLGKATQALKCSQCGRLWVFWNGAEFATEYVRVNAA